MAKAGTKKVDSVGILVVRELVRPAGWLEPSDPPFTYEKRMYTNPDRYLQYLANYQLLHDQYGRQVIEDHRTERQFQISRKHIGPWAFGGISRG